MDGHRLATGAITRICSGMNTEKSWPAFLLRSTAGKYLADVHGMVLGAKALAALAKRGKGPKFRRENGNLVYPVQELDAWVAKIRKPRKRAYRTISAMHFVSPT